MNKSIIIACLSTLLLSFAVKADLVIAEKDLALFFPISEDSLIKADDRIAGQALFPRAWYDDVMAGFQNTNVRDALFQENYFSDWAIVGIRIVPCSTSQNHVSSSNNEWCWPEIRIVWQPIIYNLRIGWQRFSHYADDRAIHTLYDIDPSLYLSSAASAKAKILLNRAKAGVLSAQEKAEFVGFARQVSATYLLAVKSLRLPNYTDSAYTGLGLRPETTDSTDARAFYANLKSFLLSHAAPSRLKELTAFSLPEGRQPALLDEWIFLKFLGDNGNITPADITIHDHNTGDLIINLGLSQSATTARDDERLYASGIINQLADSAILFAEDFQRLTPIISDRTQRLVPNTSCASCHKMNDSRFNFHNMSYLQDRFGMTVSPRVEKDVLHDLTWVNTYLSNIDIPGDDDAGGDDNSDDSNGDSDNGDGGDGNDDGSSTPPAPQRFENNTSMAIPDNDTNGIESSINASLNDTFATVNASLIISHTYRGDLEVQLIAPDSTTFTLHRRAGGGADNLNTTTRLNLSGIEANGIWRLRVKDLARRDVGTLRQWSLEFE